MCGRMETSPKPIQPLFIRIKAAAKILDIHHQTLQRWISEGRGPPVQRFGKGKNRTIRIIYPKFLEWIENPKRPGRPKKVSAQEPVNA